METYPKPVTVVNAYTHPVSVKSAVGRLKKVVDVKSPLELLPTLVADKS
jgi:hypothetical protein